MWLDWQNYPKPHRNWNPVYCWTSNPHTYTTKKHQMHDYRWSSLLHRWLFDDPVKPPRCTTRTFSQWMALIRMWVVPDCCQWLSHPIPWINGRYNLPLATHPPHQTKFYCNWLFRQLIIVFCLFKPGTCQVSLNVTGFMKTDPNRTFDILRITSLKYLTNYESLVLRCSYTNLTV